MPSEKVNDTALVLYVPAIHRGYMELLQRSSATTIYVLGRTYLREFGYFGKEIRALEPIQAAGFLGVLPFHIVRVLEPKVLSNLRVFSRFVIPDEPLLRAFAAKYLSGREIEWNSVFLRWDENKVLSQMPVDGIRTVSSLYHCRMMQRALALSVKTSDWWRQVGAVLVKDRKVLFETFNRHLPTEHTPYINGDPRDVIKAGTRSELASAIHCEQQVIAQAALRGRRLKGCHLYVTTFPCPVCAKLIALSGIRRCYFKDGHASLDGQSIMESFGVVLSRVQM